MALGCSLERAGSGGDQRDVMNGGFLRSDLFLFSSGKMPGRETRRKREAGRNGGGGKLGGREAEEVDTGKRRKTSGAPRHAAPAELISYREARGSGEPRAVSQKKERVKTLSGSARDFQPGKRRRGTSERTNKRHSTAAFE